MIEFMVPVRIESEMNTRDHWAKRKARFDIHKKAVWAGFLSIPLRERAVGIRWTALTVTMTRIGPRKLDGDNLQGGFKAVRDEIARILGVDDGDPRITWLYGQEKGKPREYAARVRIE